MQVPCGACTACCTSSQFVHIEPDETETLAHVPAALRFPAPGLPKGHVVLGYDERGHCPMLVDGACSIYEHRPRTCRTYDCRVFAVTGVEPEGQPAIAARVREWRFEIDDRERWDAVRAAVPPTGPPIERALRAAQFGVVTPYGIDVTAVLCAEQQPALEHQRALVVQQVLPPVLDEELGDEHGDDRVRPAAFELVDEAQRRGR